MSAEKNSKKWQPAMLLASLVFVATVVPFTAIGPAIRSMNLRGQQGIRAHATRQYEVPSRPNMTVVETAGEGIGAKPIVSGDEGAAPSIETENELMGEESIIPGNGMAVPSAEGANPDSVDQQVANGECLDLRKQLEGVHSSDRMPPLLPEEIQFSWVYQNNAIPDVNYSHMAMIERLPPGSSAKYMVAWQAASRLAGLRDQHVRGATSDNLVEWSSSWQFPLPQNGSIWAPVLYLDPPAQRQEANSSAAASPPSTLRLFYAESHGCTRNMPNLAEKVFAPGGDIKMAMSTDGVSWGDPETLYAEVQEGIIPKVIANQPVVTETNHQWVLPFWREDPGQADCVIGKGAHQLSGTLTSSDGMRWEVAGNIGNAKSLGDTRLLEGAVVALTGANVLQLFRSTSGWIYRSTSKDAGQSWSPPQATALPNPNSKIHAIRLRNGLVVLGYNHHKKLEDEFGGTRTALWVAVSPDDGQEWFTAARLEDSYIPRYKFHYPTLMEVDDCQVAVVYTVGQKEHASAGGVKIAVVNLSAWASKFGTEAPPVEKPPWEIQQEAEEAASRQQAKRSSPSKAARHRASAGGGGGPGRQDRGRKAGRGSQPAAGNVLILGGGMRQKKP